MVELASEVVTVVKVGECDGAAVSRQLLHRARQFSRQNGIPHTTNGSSHIASSSPKPGHSGRVVTVVVTEVMAVLETVLVAVVLAVVGQRPQCAGQVLSMSPHNDTSNALQEMWSGTPLHLWTVELEVVDEVVVDDVVVHASLHNPGHSNAIFFKGSVVLAHAA